MFGYGEGIGSFHCPVKVKESFGNFLSSSPKGQHYVALFPVVPEALISSLRRSPFLPSFTLGSSASHTVCRY